MRVESSGTLPTTVMRSWPTPVTAAYHNTRHSTSMESAGTTVRPDALFANVNGQAIPVHGIPRSSQATMNTADVSTYAPQRMTSSSTMSFRSDTGNVVNLRLHWAGAPAMAPMRPFGPSWFSDHTFNRQQYINSSNPVGLPQGMTSSSTAASPRNVARPRNPHSPPTHTSTRPGLPAQRMETMTSTNNLQSLQNDVTRLPVFAPPHIPAPAASSDSFEQAVSFPAIQIQIGARKYNLISLVHIIQNGILFHLQGLPAGLLLNVQAIVKCKANLNQTNYPALFLFLERSCARQVRNSLGLSPDDLASDNAVEIKRCITIFPRYRAGEVRAQQMMQLVEHSLEGMFQRNPGSRINMEEITDDQVLDILLGGSEGPPPPGRPTGTTTTGADTTPRGAAGTYPMQTSIQDPLTDITWSAVVNRNTSPRSQMRSASPTQPMLDDGDQTPPAFQLTGNPTFPRTADVRRDVEQPTQGDDDADDDVIMTQEEPGVKCPYTQKVMTDPVCNTICGHNYEKSAIQEFIFRRSGNARCPYVGCENVAPLRLEELQENVRLREYIQNNAS